MGIFKVWLSLLKRGNPLVLPLDTQYQTCNEEDIQRLCADFSALGFKWTTNIFDCDDFAWVFKAMAAKRGLPVGFVIGWHNGLHCWNVYISDKAHFIEPQNGEIDPKGYLPIMTII